MKENIYIYTHIHFSCLVTVYIYVQIHIHTQIHTYTIHRYILHTYIYVQVKKQHSELDMEQQTGSKLGKENVKAIYCHPVYLTSIQSTS